MQMQMNADSHARIVPRGEELSRNEFTSLGAGILSAKFDPVRTLD